MPAPAAAPPRPSPAGRCAHGRRASPAGAPATAQPGRLPPAALLPGAPPSAPGAPPWPGAPPGAPPRPSPVGVPRCVSLSDAQHRPSPAYLGAPPRHSSVSLLGIPMSRRFKQVTKGFVGKMIPSKERLFQESEEDEEAEGENAGDRQEDEKAGDRQEDEKAGDRQEDEEAGDGQEDAQADEELMGGDGLEEVVQRKGTRRSHYVNPPSIPTAADKKLIKPIGDSQWEDVTWNGTGHRRTPNGLLGNLIRVHNPGVVEKMKYYYVNPSEQNHASKVLENAANKICKDLFSNLRIQPGPYKALCDLWASEEFQERSSKHRNAGTKNATHKLGGDGYRRKAQCSVAATGESPSAVDMYIMAHRGPDPSQPELLCTPLATERLRTAPVDPQAVYESGGGKSHGRYSMFNGMTDSRQVQRRSSSQSSGGSSSRQRRTTSEMEFDSLRQEIQKRDAFLKA
ncbi:hypothetical protein U9M48_042026 [Paspalum notatum var. saurae]|uniref:Uncharacterized protein n=1 Tax=Paspalum notatum var. saurae TaxID=547442 RepID=A0AAQ3UQ99_PASNO